MDLDEVKERVAAIDASSHDDPTAHGMEDELHLDLLKAIAAGVCIDVQACAKEAIKTEAIRFHRWKI